MFAFLYHDISFGHNSLPVDNTVWCWSVVIIHAHARTHARARSHTQTHTHTHTHTHTNLVLMLIVTSVATVSSIVFVLAFCIPALTAVAWPFDHNITYVAAHIWYICWTTHWSKTIQPMPLFIIFFRSCGHYFQCWFDWQLRMWRYLACLLGFIKCRSSFSAWVFPRLSSPPYFLQNHDIRYSFNQCVRIIVSHFPPKCARFP